MSNPAVSQSSIERAPLVVIGAGPYGLAIAATALRQGVEPIVLGERMMFWRRNMPRGMLLRSGPEWHLDSLGILTLEAYLAELNLTPEDVHPIPVEVFIDYADWFVDAVGLELRAGMVTGIERTHEGVRVRLDDGSLIDTEMAVATPGAAPFANIPEEITESLPATSYDHTCGLIDFATLAGKRVLIVGGRQSAFEWAALIGEQTDAEIHIVHRHDPPRFAPSDWGFVEPLVESTVSVRGWYRSLSHLEQEQITERHFLEGRLKLEPWLPERLAKKTITRWPNRNIERWQVRPGGEIEARLTDDDTVLADHVLLATGYRVDVMKVPYLCGLADELETADGFPVLDEDSQTSVSGLYITGQAAVRDFGAFFGFVGAARAAAAIVVGKLIEAPPSQFFDRPARVSVDRGSEN